jgi:DNA modification methylase
MNFNLHHGNCLDVIKTLETNSIDSIVCDPPYGLSFMGKKWDYDVPSVEIWEECLRVLKPGGHLLAFAGTRTQHRMAVRIEDAGFEIRDMIAWVYGCLSEDSEVLTEDGWTPSNRAKQKNILTYDLQNDVYQWERPSRWNEYRVESDTAYRIQSDYTDQIVSRGHRCIVERDGVLEFVPADQLAGMERVPYLQSDFSALPQGWVCDGASPCCGTGACQAVDADGVGASPQPRRDGQSAGEPDAVCQQCGTQEVRARTSYQTTLATVTAIEYSGLIWCPTVITGAFVARRNGKVFITGNSGFPKSLDVSKAIDKAAGAEREKVKVKPRPATSGTMTGHSDTRPWIEKSRELGYHEVAGNEPATEAAKQWQGWGTSLKPSLEPVTVARKPLIGTVAENVLAHGTGGLNIDGCRVGVDPVVDGSQLRTMQRRVRETGDGWGMSTVQGDEPQVVRADGRFPANLIHDGSDEVVAGFPQSTGSAARFFYCAKTSKSERNKDTDNNHPTVKPIALMRYLCRLVTPPGGTVLDPFMGSGSTGVAALNEGFKFIGCEMSDEYFKISHARISSTDLRNKEEILKQSNKFE